MDDHYNPSAEDDEDEALARHLSTHNHRHSLPQSSTSPTFSHTEYRHPSVPTIDPSLDEGSLRALKRNGKHSDVHKMSSSHVQHQNNSPLTSQHFPRQLYTDIARTALFPPAPSSAVSPRFSGQTTPHQTQMVSSYVPNDRSLPMRDVTDLTIDDAYVAFILYCNPTVPLSTESTELRRGFRAPPKSDGKSFSTFTLLQLIRELEVKEIKTWTQLAIKLGVEPPVMEKNQSAQKVQQYAVRLKRWMHAMHVDAYFEYCLGKPHAYYTRIPPFNAPHPEFGRDGVPPEEDLALRALHPESKPKRGRRKTEDRDNDSDRDISPAKRPHINTSNTPADLDGFGNGHSGLFPHSGIPSSGQSDEMDRFVNHLDPWAAASAITPSSLSVSTSAHTITPHLGSGSSGGQHFRWRLNARETTPSTPHPQSALTPSISHPPDSAFDEPLSAVTPSSSCGKGRLRRRHGPAVSSAWPSSGNPLTGKLRGRPPSNRSVRDGPFSTFPANPKTKEGPLIDFGGGTTPISTPVTGREDNRNGSRFFQFPAPGTDGTHRQTIPGKPSRLHLQVPQHVGGSVQLATPTLLVNGESDHVLSPALAHKPRRPSSDFFDDSTGMDDDGDFDADDYHQQQQAYISSAITLEDIERHFTAKILKADFEDHRPIGLEEAKRVAEKGMHELRRHQDAEMQEETYLMSAATWLGFLRQQSPMQLKIRRSHSPATASGALRSRDDRHVDGLHPHRDGLEDVNEGKDHFDERGNGKILYDISWTFQFGPLTGQMALQVYVSETSASSSNHGLQQQHDFERFPSSEDGDHSIYADDTIDASETGWREKLLAMQKKVRESNEEAGRLRRKVLEAVL
ncbi:MAG: hypothetical protein M1827_002091 [Pycnora praestabilis]|nr:MAG: hypothetical protein M1827_002091 [Pycnora praestabilis]